MAKSFLARIVQHINGHTARSCIARNEGTDNNETLSQNRDVSANQSEIHAILLEERVLYSAAPLPMEMLVDLPELFGGQAESLDAADMFATTETTINLDSLYLNEEDSASTFDLSQLDLVEQSTESENPPTSGIVFVDSGVQNYELLIADIESNSFNLSVHLLDSNRDGIQQISEVLGQQSNVDSIHILSHASDGKVQLGNTSLSADTLDGYAGQIAAWGSSLTADADILIYGCELAGSSSGVELVESLAELTDADIAASDDLTGHESLGGDWELEYNIGDLESSIIVSSDFQADWIHVLAPPSIDLDGDDSAATGADYLTTFQAGGIPVSIVDLDFSYTDPDSTNWVELQVDILGNPADWPNEILGYDLSGTGITLFQWNANAGRLILEGDRPISEYLQVLQTLTYENTAVTNTTPRTIEIHVEDAEGNLSNVAISTVNILEAGAAIAIDDAYAINEDTALDSNSDWFDPNWSYRRTLSFDNAAQTEDLTDFPVLVTLDASRIDYSQTQNNGQDLRFVDGDGTLLAYEIEEWNESGTSYVWVKLPQIDGSSNTDFIHMYYGNAVAAAGQSPVDVWDANHQGVWHLDETSGPNDDSTVNDYDLASFGGVDQNAIGQIAGATSFDGINDYLGRTNTNTNLHITGDVTLDAWIRMDAYPTGNWAGIVEIGGMGSNAESQNFLYTLSVHADGEVALGHESGSGTNQWINTGVILDTNQWYHLTAVRDSSALEWELFVDGTQAGSTYGYAQNATGGGNGDVFVGSDDNYFNGTIDEIRISDTDRSADWIAAQHASGLDSFVDYGYEQTVAGVLGNDIDFEGDPLTATLVSGPSNAGSFTFNPDGSFTYTPTADFNGVDSFTYTTNDGNSDSNVATVTITVDPVNDNPTVGIAVSSIANEDAAVFAVDLLNGANDVDASDTLSVSGMALTVGDDSGVTVGVDSLSVDPGAYNYLAIGETEVITYSYNIVDGNGGSVSQTATITITGVNDAPVLSNNQLTLNEGQTIILDASNFDASDVETPDASLNFTVTNVAGGHFALTTDTITPIFSFTKAQIDSGNIVFVDNGDEAAPSYDVEVNDGDGLIDGPEAGTINFTNINDAPLAAIVPSAFGVNEDAPPTPLGGISVLDVDAGGNDIEVTVSVNDGSVSLATMTGLSITGGANGTDTLTVLGNVTDLNNALATLRYQPDPAFFGSDLLTLTVDDLGNTGGGSLTDTDTATIFVTAANDDPTVGLPVSAGATEDDSAFVIDMLNGANDVEGDTLNVSGLTLDSGNAAGITVLGNSLNVDPAVYNYLAVGESEVIQYSYNVDDGNGGSVPQTATITITGVNDGPTVGAAVTGGATEDDAAFVVDMLSGAGDPDTSDSINVSGLTLVSGNAAGVTAVGNNLNVDPSAYNYLAVGETEDITYSYNVDDGNGGSVPQTATITITGANDDPAVSAAVTAAATQDDPGFLVSLLDNASDSDISDTLSISGLTLFSGNGGGITVAGNDLSVDPSFYSYLSTGDTEIIVYNFNVIDGNGGSVAQSATITISGGNQDPVVSGQLIAGATEDDTAYSVDLLSGASDQDATDTINVSGLALVSGDDSGITIAGNNLNINPNAYNDLAVGETEFIKYSYNIIDGNGGTVAQTATITITGVNDGPVVGAPVIDRATEDDAAFVVDLLNSATDPDSSDTISTNALTLISGDASGVTIAGNNLNIDPAVYNHLAAGESEIIQYSYNVVDGNGGVVVQTATITITGVNDGPAVGAPGIGSATEDDAVFAINLLNSATDPDATDVLNVTNLSLTSGDDSGVSILGNIMNVDPTAYNHLAVGESEVIQYSFDVEDSNGGLVAQTATITITGANDAPIVSSAVIDGASEDAGAWVVNLLQSASDVDLNDALVVDSLTLIAGDDSGVTIGSNVLTIDPNNYNSLALGETEVIAYSYNIQDGNGGSVTQTATITVTGANDAPIVVDNTYTQLDGDPVSGNLLTGSFDIESESLTVTLVTPPTGGSLLLNPDGTFVFTPDEGFFGIVTVHFNASDGLDFSNTGTATIVVGASAPVDPPTINDSDDDSEDDDDDELLLPPPNGPDIKIPEPPGSETTRGPVATPVGFVSSVPNADFEPEETSIQHIDNQKYNYITATSIEVVSAVSPTTNLAIELADYSTQMLASLELFDEDLESAAQSIQFAQLSTVVSLSGVSVGVVTWILRSGALLASMMANLPAWRMIDPLVVLGHSIDEDESNDESLLDIVENNNESNSLTVEASEMVQTEIPGDSSRSEPVVPSGINEPLYGVEVTDHEPPEMEG